MSKTKRAPAFIAAAVMLLVLLSGCYLLPEEEAILDPPELVVTDLEYKTYTVTRGDIQKADKYYGRFVAKDPKDIQFTYAGGRVSEIPVDYYQEIKAGDVLLKLDTEDLEYQMAKLEIQYQEKEYYYNKNIRSGNEEVRKNAQWDWDAFLLDYNRVKSTLETSTMLSPIDGRIIYMANISVNDVVGVYSTLFTVADIHDTVLAVNSKDACATLVDHKTVEVYVDDVRYTGEVVPLPGDEPRLIDTTIADETAYIRVSGLPAGEELFGKEARVVINLASAKDVIVLPAGYVHSFGGRIYVNVLEDGVKVERDVTTGITDGSMFEITSGLEEGDVIIIG